MLSDRLPHLSAMWEGAGNANSSGTTATLYKPKAPQPDSEVLKICAAAVPTMAEEAAAAAADLDATPEDTIQKMLTLCDHVRYGLGYRAALGATGIIPKLIAMCAKFDAATLADAEERTPAYELALKAAKMLFALSRHKENAQATAAAGAIPIMVSMFRADSSFNVVMGGPAAGTLKKIASHGTPLLVAVSDAGGMDALLIGFRNYPINDDVEESVPANATRMAYEQEIAEYKASLEEGEVAEVA